MKVKTNFRVLDTQEKLSQTSVLFGIESIIKFIKFDAGKHEKKRIEGISLYYIKGLNLLSLHWQNIILTLSHPLANPLTLLLKGH